MDGLKLAQAVHLRWPAIKIILVSGQVKPTDDDKPADSRFFGKPVDVKELISELRNMIGAGALKVIPETAIPLAVEKLAATGTTVRSAAQDSLTAEIDSLRLLLEQASFDAKVLLAQAGIDAKERAAADTLQKLMMEELHHRIKNTLATVSAIASQSLRTAPSIEHGQQAIEGRLVALGRAHDLLMQAQWANASLAQTVRSATEPYDSKGKGHFSLEGPDVGITSGAVIALAMTFNELGTNTTKFGALSVPSGRVKISWNIDDGTQRLRMTWRETGGPAVEEPTRRSFGTRMMGSLGHQLNGQVTLAYEPAGFVYVLDVPLSSLTAKSESQAKGNTQ
jgi:two-component sensor histidine kinase